MSPVAALPPVAVAPHAVSVVSRSNPAPHGWTTYVVRAGDTLYDLALRHRTTTGAIVVRNHLRDGGSLITTGSRILVPRTSATRGAVRHHSPRTTAPVRRTVGRMHSVRVRRGDTVYAIALRGGVSQAALIKANRLADPRLLQIGRVLRVPGRVGRPAAAARFGANTFEGRRYPRAVVSSAAANRAYLAGRSVPSRSETRRLIVSAARAHGVDHRLALAIAWQESGWNQRQVSVANAIGAMQVIPSSGQWAGQLVGRRINLLDTRDNVTAGVVILRALNRSARSEKQAVAGYYQGLASVQAHGMYADTRRYVASVLALKARM